MTEVFIEYNSDFVNYFFILFSVSHLVFLQRPLNLNIFGPLTLPNKENIFKIWGVSLCVFTYDRRIVDSVYNLLKNSWKEI